MLIFGKGRIRVLKLLFLHLFKVCIDLHTIWILISNQNKAIQSTLMITIHLGETTILTNHTKVFTKGRNAELFMVTPFSWYLYRVATKFPSENSRIIQGYFKDLSLIFTDVQILRKHHEFWGFGGFCHSMQ